MDNYLVVWKINIYTDSPEEAAQEARRIQQDPESIATHFEVQKLTRAGHRDGHRVQIELGECSFNVRDLK